VALWRVFEQLPPGSQFYFDVLGTTIATKREAAGAWVLDDPTLEWLLFIDADMTPTPEVLDRLLAWQVDVVGATYVKRTPPYPIAASALDGRYVTLTADMPPLVEVEFTGTGCMLIRSRVLRTLRRPWFPADPIDAIEDRNFCCSARAAGFPVFLDTTLRIGHLGLQSLIAPDPRVA